MFYTEYIMRREYNEELFYSPLKRQNLITESMALYTWIRLCIVLKEKITIKCRSKKKIRAR
jgi:hypothetical protein